MSDAVRRVFVEKREGFDIEARQLFGDIRERLGLEGLTGLRVLKRYDLSGLSDGEYAAARDSILSEPNCDRVFEETLSLAAGETAFAVEYLPGQYDQRADSAAQCIQLLTQGERPLVRSATVYIFIGSLRADDLVRCKAYLVNPVESREASLEKPASLLVKSEIPADVAIMTGFNSLDKAAICKLTKEMGLAMSSEDLAFCQSYFRDEEKREPTLSEIKVIDTYWSDHCRHTTFHTSIDETEIDLSPYTVPVCASYKEYKGLRKSLGREQKTLCLMDLATIGVRELKRQGKLDNLDASDEINACSIEIDADVNGHTEKWLVMFKNETHNHPTEIEPFGGAATCLGGAIRDPLSGRSYVYQAMRITGAGDPRLPISETLAGKLPQRKICRTAAAGYSSYGNQIGLAAGKVQEIYHPGFVAKRMELGAVIAAAPKENVIRAVPAAGDVILLIGGRTGRDGCGGATGSSKAHTGESLATCGAEVQKGNPLTERNIQRLFRNPAFSKLVKRCNDFGAGGVCVAIGELSPGLVVDLDKVPKKYDGLDGTELAISESQERMAVVIAADKVEAAIALSHEENLEATAVAVVSDVERLKMTWRGKTIIDLSRAFLDTNGVTQHASAHILAPEEEQDYFKCMPAGVTLKEQWLNNLQDLNVCSQKGLVERFDGTIGASSVISPYGGKMRLTPNEAMVAKLPVSSKTCTATVMSHGYNPYLSEWSPYHGALYAVIESLAKIVIAGGDPFGCRLSFQEFFERLNDVPESWGKPLAALLGGLKGQLEFGTGAIGGKDSMSGTFEHISVPPTLVSFAVNVLPVSQVTTNVFTKAGSKVYVLTSPRDKAEMPDFQLLKENFRKVYSWIAEKKCILSGATIGHGGIAAAVSKMCFGNMLGLRLADGWTAEKLFDAAYGGFVLESDQELEGAILLGTITDAADITVGGESISLSEACRLWQAPLEKVYPTTAAPIVKEAAWRPYNGGVKAVCGHKCGQPRVFIPVFPGTNCEYDTQRAFEFAGAIVNTLVIRNKSANDIEESVQALVAGIRNAQIVAFPGGFSGGDEPDGSGKFIATTFRNPRVAEAVTELLKNRDGLMLGICNGFQALIKLGLVPFGEIRPQLGHDDPTLTFNTIGRHAATTVNTVVASNMSPWLALTQPGAVHSIPISHGEGRFVATPDMVEQLFKNGQVAFQYADLAGKPAVEMPWNPNGSVCAIEGITSPDGRVLGKMGHSERVVDDHISLNVPGQQQQGIFKAGVLYFA